MTVIWEGLPLSQQGGGDTWTGLSEDQPTTGEAHCPRRLSLCGFLNKRGGRRQGGNEKKGCCGLISGRRRFSEIRKTKVADCVDVRLIEKHINNRLKAGHIGHWMSLS